MPRKGFEQRRMCVRQAPKDHTHVALALMYTGTAFRGLQVQTHGPTHHTVEGVLIQALKDAGFIEEIERGRPQSHLHHFARSCRTDRGVHAIRNLISLFIANDRLSAAGGMEAVAAKVNRYLPPAVRVAHASVVAGNFIPRSCCNRRVYRYLIPAYALLAPADAWSTLAKLHPRCEESATHWATDASGSTSSDACEPPFLDLHNTRLESHSERDAWLLKLRDAVKTCNQFLNDTFVGSHRFHNYSAADVDARGNALSNSKLISPESDVSVRTIHRCEIAPRVYFVKCDADGVTREEYRDNLRQRPHEVSGGAPPPMPQAAAAKDGFLWRPFVVFQIEGVSFLFNMIRKVVGTALAVVRGASAQLAIEALSPERRVATPLAPGSYLLLAISTYHGYDSMIRAIRRTNLHPIQSEWDGTVAADSERFAWHVIARDILDTDSNSVPPLDDLLAARDDARSVARPEWKHEDKHLASMKEYKPTLFGRVPPAACSEMTKFLRLLRVHNWSVRTVPLPPTSKAMLELSNQRKKQEREALEGSSSVTKETSDVDGASTPAEAVAPVTVPDGGEDGWIYVTSTREEVQARRQEFFANRWKRSRPWEYDTSAGDKTVGEGGVALLVDDEKVVSESGSE